MTETIGRLDTLVGLNVTSAESYTRYRAGMTPILEAHGGFFRYDFRIEQVLKSDAPHPINRLFVISFPTARARDAFFENEEYLEVRREFFAPAVEGTTIIATYETEAR